MDHQKFDSISNLEFGDSNANNEVIIRRKVQEYKVVFLEAALRCMMVLKFVIIAKEFAKPLYEL